MRKSFQKMLAHRMHRLRMTYEDLARAVGLSGVYVSKIVQGKVVPSDDVIHRLSEALDLPLDELILAAHYEKAPEAVKPIFERLSRHRPEEFMGDGAVMDNIELTGLGRGRPVPVVGMVRAGEFAATEDGEYPAGVADGYVYTDRKGENLFAVRVVNDSMEPVFHEGDVLVVNPNLEAGSGDYVIAKLMEDNEATFKKLVRHEGLVILRPLNPSYADIVVTDLARVALVGKVVERKTLL